MPALASLVYSEWEGTHAQLSILKPEDDILRYFKIRQMIRSATNSNLWYMNILQN